LVRWVGVSRRATTGGMSVEDGADSVVGVEVSADTGAGGAKAALAERALVVVSEAEERVGGGCAKEGR